MTARRPVPSRASKPSAARACALCIALIFGSLACGHYGPPKRSEAVAAAPPALEQPAGPAPAEPKPEADEAPGSEPDPS